MSFTKSMNMLILCGLGIVVSSTITLPANGQPKAKAGASKKNAASPAYAASVPKPTLAEVRYGTHERHVLDFWKAESNKPTPLAFIIHGGGWKGGSKERADKFVDVAALLKDGISVAAINYRFVDMAVEEGVKPPVKVPLHDAARALQFVRSKATEWNIDKNRVGAAGGSAGACSSLWLAFHDDLADPKNSDLVARESSRLQCAAVTGAQTTLDPKQMKEWTPNSKYGGHAFGVGDFANFLAEREKILPWIAEYSPYALVNAGDPAVYLIYSAPPALGQDQKDPTHTSNFGVKLQEHCLANKVECELAYPGSPNVKHATPTDFLIAKLTKNASAPSPGSALRIRWEKHTINDQSPFEACGAADFNGDGKIDVFSGDSWYEAPNWTRHKVRDVPAAKNPHYYEDFCDSPLDVNGDGRVDIVTCNYFGRYVGWVENPGSDGTRNWIEHEIDKPGSMETAELIDLNGDGKLDFLPNVGQSVCWYELTQQKPSVVWKKHDLGKAGAGHGVGAGDVNRDGRIDIITPKGWYEAPANASDDNWSFHDEFSLGATGIFIHGRDIDGDQLTDIVWGMGHAFGLYWLKQSKASDGKREWTKHEIDGTFSQVHTLSFANLDGQGEPELITGKRVYAHEVEPGDIEAPVVFSYRFDRASSKWIKETIFHGEPALNAPSKAEERWALKDFARGNAGTGLQMATIDLDKDGDIDLVCPGKTGLYWFENQGRSK